MLESVIEQYLNYCFRERTAVRVSEMARFMGLAPGSVTRVFKQALGKTPRQVLRDRQIAEAIRLLRESLLSVETIALQAGFGTRNTFSRVFLRATGVSPAQFRRVKN